MRTIGLALSLLAAGVSLPSQAQPTQFDPTGKWKVSTRTDEGTPMTVSVDITGKPGAYQGKAVTSEGRELPLTDLATTPTGMIAVFALPQGAIVVSLSGRGDGRFSGEWGAIPQTVGLTAERSK